MKLQTDEFKDDEVTDGEFNYGEAKDVEANGDGEFKDW